MSIKAFLTAKSIQHTVNDQELNFYPASLRVAYQLKNIIRPLASGFASILADKSNDKGYTSTSTKDTGDGQTYEQTVVEPIAVPLAEYRSGQKERAILDFLESFTADASQDALVRLILDSLRDDYQNRNFEKADINEFLESVDTATMTQLLTGVAKANKSIFGKFGDKLGNLLGQMMQKLEHQATAFDAEDPANPLQQTDEQEVDSNETTGPQSVV